MKSTVVYLSALLLIYGCTVLPKGYRLSEFYYNGKKQNSLIINRVPDYGDGHPDGCIIKGEMRLSIKSLSTHALEGQVVDVITGKPLMGANVFIQLAGGDWQLKYHSDSLGRFTFMQEPIIKNISVAAPGYRSLTIDVSKLTRKI